MEESGKSRLKEKWENEFDGQLKACREISAMPYENPQKIVGRTVAESTIDGMQVFTWNDKQDKNQKNILYFHGGAYTSQPNTFHFSALNNIAEKLDAKALLPIYPKVPRFTYKDAYPKLDKLYRNILEKTASNENLTIIGDSSGGGLALGFAMYARDKHLAQPKDIILLSPWLDINTNNREIVKYEAQDPILSPWALNKLGTLWAGSAEDTKNPYISPIFGAFSGLGKISIFVGTHEIFLPDNEKLHKLLTAKGIKHNYFVAEKMQHVYAIKPIPEGKMAQNRMVEIIKQK